MFPEKHVRVFSGSYDQAQKRAWTYTISLPHHQI